MLIFHQIEMEFIPQKQHIPSFPWGRKGNVTKTETKGLLCNML